MRSFRTFALWGLLGGLSLFWPSVAFCADPTYGDMYEISHWASANRPEVPSDGTRRHRDLIPPVPIMYDEDADLFDSMRVRNAGLPKDMLHTHPVSTYPSSRPFQEWANE